MLLSQRTIERGGHEGESRPQFGVQVSACSMTSARDVLGPGSPLAKALPGWEHRHGQLQMATAVEVALDEERHLLVEAGTGTGKTLAYLVPAVLSGRKVIVSTATKALQEQIFVKDLPLVAETLGTYGIPVRAALMKGLSNYLCLRRFDEARVSGEHLADREFARIESWLKETQSGDRAELSDLPEDARAWREVASSSETRIGSGCPHFEQCYVTRMRREAEDAQIVVVNHHLFLADLSAFSGPRGARERAAGAVRRGHLRRGPPDRRHRDRLLRHARRARGSTRSFTTRSGR